MRIISAMWNTWRGMGKISTSACLASEDIRLRLKTAGASLHFFEGIQAVEDTGGREYGGRAENIKSISGEEYVRRDGEYQAAER